MAEQADLMAEGWTELNWQRKYLEKLSWCSRSCWRRSRAQVLAEVFPKQVYHDGVGAVVGGGVGRTVGEGTP